MAGDQMATARRCVHIQGQIEWQCVYDIIQTLVYLMPATPYFLDAPLVLDALEPRVRITLNSGI